MGAPKGNKNAEAKPWTGALRKALARVDERSKRGALEIIAEQVVEMAKAGDKDSWQEIGNRLDGKPHQTIAADVETNVTVEIVKFGGKK